MGLTGVELLGGSSRVPLVKARLSELLNGRSLDTHLDADEAVVLGAGYVAANLSTIFRLRTFGMTDKAMFHVDYELDYGASGSSARGGIGGRADGSTRSSRRTSLPTPLRSPLRGITSAARRWTAARSASRWVNVVVSGIDAVVKKTWLFR